MGLGLAVCHGIVTAHEGEIRVDSKVGAGTRVTVILPVAGARQKG
jgi:signal transduction histidine kinase